MRPREVMTDQTRSLAPEPYPPRRVILWDWSPTQLIGYVVGLVFVVLGGVALARTGVDFQHLTLKHVQVAGAGHTQLLAYLEIAYGILMLAAASVRDGRGLMSFLGLTAVAFGLIVAIQPSSFRHSLGITGSGFGVFLVVVGVIVIIAAEVRGRRLL
jgi:hypothetical protein